MLRLDSICKAFHGKDVLKHLSCSISEGDFVVLMGQNGTGKSTLFDIISGKTEPDTGRILLDGVDITHVSEQKRALSFARLFQNTYLGSCSELTVRENFILATLKGRRPVLKSAIKRLSEVVEQRLLSLDVSFDAFLDVPMGALSGGQRQMIAFIMATLQKPKFLLLDEPTAALDEVSAEKLLVFAKNYAENERVPTLMISHDPLIAQRFGSKVWLLREGAIEVGV